MKKVILFLLFLPVATTALAVEGIPRTPQMKMKLFDGITADLACLCGCGTTVKTCPHDSCSFAVPIRKEIHSMIDSGLTRKDIIAKLVSTRGEALLAAPTFSGFNIMAWVTPFFAILLVGYFVVVLVRNWSAGRKVSTAPVPSGVRSKGKGSAIESDPAFKRMQDELEKFDS